jgi:(2Fe-2S) ferredoxin
MVLSGCVQWRYPPDGPTADAASLSPQETWRASGTIARPELAIDGKYLTAASSSGGGPATLVIDLGRMCMFNLAVCYHGDDDCCRGRATLSVSTDGQEYRRVAEASAQRQASYLLAGEPVVARYVRLEFSDGTRPWRVAEVRLK